MLDWGIMVHYFPFLLQGAVLTLKISVFALILGFIFGISAALLKLSKNPLLRSAAGFYIWIIRSTPLLVQLFLIYFGLPQLGIDLGSFFSGVLGLALNIGAYNAEAIRGGIISVPSGQMEASRSLGMSSRLAMRRIILPQAMRIALPSLGNNFIILIKDTSLVSTITLVELTLTAQRLIGSTYKPFEMYLMAAFLYAVLTTATSLVLGRVEKRMAY
ncbi:amino acid ABC transporter permease [Geovibrio thiophilus]|uniref:Putative glutamine transport system permease protein GlnP n=1 Tax=Geovibrio thiophilus TaxID=139438 RepID=A0A3R5Y6Q0_9BACT|nr:amino acid ABC transporter permease [Geovibrio thiophilus]QAR33007.1 amino acid ABC transporter permease [Geovibrio thiophilus]